MEIAQQKIFRAVVRPRLFADYLRDISVQRLTVLSLDPKMFWYLDPPETDAEKDEIYLLAMQRLLLNEDELESHLRAAAMKGEFRYVWPDFKEGVILGGGKVRPTLSYEDQIFLQLIYKKFTGVKLIPTVRRDGPHRYFVNITMIW